jgi:thioredoxin reductase (NADPH)
MKPIILAVDDDADVLKAVERDLRKQYGNRFRVFRAESGSIGLELLKRLKLRNDIEFPQNIFLILSNE